MKTKYAFNLGRVYTLSLAEIFAVFEKLKLSFNLIDLYKEILIIETEEELDARALQKTLGGTVKIMIILEEMGRKKDAGPTRVFQDYFDIKVLREKIFQGYQNGKITFGISIYQVTKELPYLRDENKRVGLDIKKIMKVAGIPSRVVFPQKGGLALPSVVVTNERLLETGAEIDFLIGMDKLWLAKTLTVQNFEDYGRRDYQRPVRNSQVGMLPPKVAQAMVNLAKLPEDSKGNPEKAVLDPFVGSGTIIQEAMIQGYKGVGSDISEEQVRSAETNLEWIRNRYSLPPGRYDIIKSDVANLKKRLPKLDFPAVVTEGTLGPTYKEPPTKQEVEKNFKDLEKIYLVAFKSFKNILKGGQLVVIALPAYRLSGAYTFFPIIDKIEKLGYNLLSPVPEVLLEQFDFLQVTDRRSIIYDRKDQFVSREIFIFQLK